jgi:hypothetical protein
MNQKKKRKKERKEKEKQYGSSICAVLEQSLR